MDDTRLSNNEHQDHTYGENNDLTGLEVLTEEVLTEDVHHKEKSPQCSSPSDPQSRTKKFVSYDSLRYEQERLETFIDWPVEWLNPTDLARDGFYYLRTADHCACVFCRGIVGVWEKGDNPREEHRRHFPHCPFINGQPVGNIPQAYSNIISRITPSMDVCGSGRPTSYSEGSRSPSLEDLALDRIGLPRHNGPKRKDFLSKTNRENSFTYWPEKVKQTPKALSEAGFFYCGLSDHVRCFHCGNGLRNWEKDDDPWQEHAKWYPECNYVILKKGQEYIDGARREKTPSAKTNITEQELDTLMELDNINATLAMGFPIEKVREALRKKIEQTGLPFFRLETCIEAVLQYMEEISHMGDMQQSSTRNTEVEAQQGAQSIMSSAHSLSSSSSTSCGRSSQPEPCSLEEPMETSLISSSSEADQVLDLAEQVPASSSTSTPTDAHPNLATSTPSFQSHDNMTKPMDKLSSSGKPQRYQELVAELEKIKDSRMCKVCMDAEMDIVFLPCSHMVTCSSCALVLTQCPICRNEIKYAIKPICV